MINNFNKLYKIKIKLIELLLNLLIASFTAMINTDDYSIISFKDRMKNEGLFDLIQSIKDFYGQDVAIISCEELNKNHCGNCQKLVTDYMLDGNSDRDSLRASGRISRRKPSEKHGGKSSSRNFMKQTKEKVIEYNKLNMKDNIKDILKEKLTPEKSELFANNIVETYYNSSSRFLKEKLN